MTQRKEIELDIIYALDDIEKLSVALNKARTSGLFTEQELDIIQQGSKHFQEAPEKIEKIERVTTLAKKIGPTTSFVLLNLIKQLPYANIQNDYFYPNRRTIKENCNINDKKLTTILIDLASEELIYTKLINKKLCISLNWYKIQEMSD